MPDDYKLQRRTTAPFRRFVGLGLVVLLTFADLAAAQAQGEPKALKSPAKDAMGPSGFSFRLKPKSFQENPELAMTVITEMTAEGRKRVPVSPEEPAYYGMQSLGQQTFGPGDAGKIVIPAERLKKMMQTALAQNGYLTAKTPEHPPTLALAYQWGLHAKFQNSRYTNGEIASLLERAEDEISRRFAADAEYELENSPELRLEWLIMNHDERRNLQERASLVGGAQFTYDLNQVLEKTREITLLARSQYPPNYFPDLSGGPLRQLLGTNPKVRRLFDQAAYDIYFVIVVAYDFDAYLRGERHALWGTKMTVNTEGVSMLESLPPVIAAAAPYFGREMKEAATLLQPIHREDKIEIGPLRVIGQEADPAPKEEKK